MFQKLGHFQETFQDPPLGGRERGTLVEALKCSVLDDARWLSPVNAQEPIGYP